ncbi:MAG: VWA domain-containing protein [Anaerolineaceae bacterium]|nr:VWA domain-containing protein [Anaerolineaceae bacterium]
MKRLLYLVPFFLLLLALPVQAQVECPTPQPCPPGSTCPVIVPCPQPPIIRGVFTNPEWLKIDYHRVTVTIENQIATTQVDLEFVNEGNGLAEGTFIFPLPAEASVDQLTMYINGQPIEAKILPASEARGIYNEIVRQYRDPALLEYVGTNAVQANVFPIPPGESRRIQISYGQVLEAENGLIHYVYPLKVTNLLTPRPVEELSISVNARSNDPISNIYSPSHPVAISRDDANNTFRVGFESGQYVPGDDFSLYYGIANETINVNLITYRESASEDGFFMLLVQPPVTLPENQVIPKDVIVVLDQSGSMFGDKWDQARTAAEYVLEHLNPEDRFNLVLFSTGWRTYSTQMESPAQVRDAVDWVRTQEAIGGTDINGALTTAIGMADAERPTTILFLTDGLATEGEVETDAILKNLEATARPNVRIFTFGVGDDVDTFLLDAIVRDHRGAGSYVRPTERIDEEVAGLYNKISAPVLTDVTLDMGGVNTQDMYPAQPLPDLFAGTQLTLVGRYRGSLDNTTITLRGKVNGGEQTYVYSNLSFPGRAGGDAFIARLWATRRIGDLLNTIRLNGENPELVDSVVRLSVRYGIITPYTSFLIEEDDILTQQGRERAANTFRQEAEELSTTSSGAGAVDAADFVGGFANAEAPAPANQPMLAMTATPLGTMTPGGIVGGVADGEGYSIENRAVNPIQTVNSKTFILQNGVWTDTTFEPDTMQTQPVVFLSDGYFALLDSVPELADYFAIGERVIVVWDGVAYEVVSE